MISSRFAFPVILLLVVALIPTILHSYIGAAVNDGKAVKKIPSTLHNFTSVPSKRYSEWGKDIFDSDDWFERIYQNNQQTKIRLFVARSYDHKRLYHHPELAVSYGQSFTKKDIINLPQYPGIPVHLLSKDDNSTIVAYTLVYDGSYIRDPIAHQLSDSMRLLVNPRKPLTLFYVSQSGLAKNTQFEQSDAASLLSLAIQSFR